VPFKSTFLRRGTVTLERGGWLVGWLVVFFGEDLGRSKGRVGMIGVGLTDILCS